MTQVERAFWQRVQRQVAQTQGQLSAELLRAFDRLASGPSQGQLLELLRVGNVDGVVTFVLGDPVLQQAFGPARELLREAVARAATSAELTMPTGRTLPRLAGTTPRPAFGPPTAGTRFDLLNPNTLNAVSTLESQSLERMGSEMQQAVRQNVQRGLQDGVNPTVIARDLRAVIGLTPRQEEIVNNYRRALEGDPSAGNPLDRKLRDKRFDRTVANGNLTAAQVDRMTEAYRQRQINYTASLNARTVAAEANRVGQRLSWQQAIAEGTGGATVMKRWVHSGVPVEPRPEHLAMDGVEVPFDQPYPNGDMYPGQHDPWNCRCVEVYRLARIAAAA